MYYNVLEYLEAAYEKRPDKVIVGDINRELSYKTFMRMAQGIGSQLLQKDIHHVPVAVLIDRDVYSLVAFMGIVYAGCTYVPIDRSLPKERIEKILEVINPKVLLIHEDDKKQAQQLSFYGEILDILQLSKAEPKEENLRVVRETHLDTNPLYIMFTSGSTGVPKGVVISHKSVIDLVEQFQKVFAFNDQDIFANQAPFDFDVSVKDWYLTLMCGGTMQIVPRSMFVMPKGLVTYLNERKVSVLIWAASALGVIAGFQALKNEIPKYIRKIMFSGEVLPMKVLHYWQKYLPDAEYVNLYGPTEITCNCTYYKVNRTFQVDEVLPIGKAFPNTEVLLLKENQEASKGEIGEICIRGTGLALGYYGARAVTDTVFCQNPLQTAYRDLIYRTGDMGYYNELNELVFAARKDSQIKHMGHRIELGEIEAAVNGLEKIEKCCCLYDKDNNKIILIYQAKEEMNKMIIGGLQEKLPKYMCPNRLFQIEKIPMNAHDKIDRVMLKYIYLGK